MWIYQKANGGYIRRKTMNSGDTFMYNVLTYDKTRPLWRKIIGWIWCNVMHHKESGVCIAKGYVSRYGTFRLEICKNCYSGVLFCERNKDEPKR